MTGPNPPLTFCRYCSHDQLVHGPDGCQAEVLHGGTDWGPCGCELYVGDLQVGTFGTPPAARSGKGVSRSPDVDANVALMRQRPGEKMLVDTPPGYSAGKAYTYKARGCRVTTRKVGAVTQVWAWWPDGTEPEPRRKASK